MDPQPDGIGARRIATSESTSYMAAEASIKALENAGVKPEEIDLILLATSSPDYCFPNGACEVQGRIGAVNAACFDPERGLHWICLCAEYSPCIYKQRHL